LSSSGHRYANVDLDDPNFERTQYEPFVAYGRSKTANILFAVAFDERHRDRGVRAAAVRSGGIKTELSRHIDPSHTQAIIDQINQHLAAGGRAPFQWKTIPQGAATSAISEGVRGYALDAKNAEILWKKSGELVGESF
jgi:NAD(P)-dependent dehydrogenase (short-subunit alcohol dehydrogenase family)